MECFENYRSGNPKCTDCWLRDCCKFTRNEKEQNILNKIRTNGLTISQFDGERLSELKVGHNRSLVEFLELGWFRPSNETTNRGIR